MLMGNLDYLDLSLIKNQNELAVKIANFFTKDELNYIDLSKLEKENRNLDQIQYIYYSKDFDNRKSIKIIDTLILDSYPAARYVTIRLSIGEMEQLDYKCKYNKNIISLLNQLFARAYNYKFWKRSDDDHIIKPHITKEYSDKMKKELSVEELEEVRFIITYLIDDGSIKTDNEFAFDFVVGKFNFYIESNSVGIIKFNYKGKKDMYWNRIMFSKTDTGVANINLLIQQALNNI
jgi:hypothetical protein